MIAVADHRHFGKAAKACFVTQPTLSQQIAKAEEDLGLPIFDREKKPVVPTPEGEAFIEQARVILREHRRLKEIAKARSGEVSGPFRLAIIPTVAATLVPHFIESFSRKYPKVDLSIEEPTTDDSLEALREDRLDAAVMATPLPAAGFLEDPLYYEPFKLYLSKDHPLVARKSVAKEDLDGAGLWLLRDGHCFKDQVVRYCSLGGEKSIFRNVHFQSGNLDTLRRLVRQGHGYTLIPAFMTAYMGEAEIKAHVRSFSGPEPARQISLVSRRANWKKNISLALKECILKNLPEEMRTSPGKKLEVLEIC
jgi:LysR family hydrogen peroxide-inducible transcriptional activator